MIYFLQIIKMLNKEQRDLFISLFEDLSFEIDEMGYEGHETELVNEMLDNHLGIFMENDKQLNSFTAYILKNEGKIEEVVNRGVLYLNI